MLICVCLKPAFRTDLPLRLEPGGGGIRAGEAMEAPGPGDRAALTRAVDLRRTLSPGARLLALSVVTHGAGAAAREALRQALAHGADEAMLVRGGDQDTGEGKMDLAEAAAEGTRRRAQAAAQALAGREPALILAGERSGDSARGCFGAFLAHALGAGYARKAGTIAGTDGGWRVTVLLEGGYGQEMLLPRPAVVTLPPGGQPLPPPPLPAWMASRRARIPEITAAAPVPPGASAGGAAGGATLRVPLPRVKSHPVPQPHLTAGERIADMVTQEAGAGGEVLQDATPDEMAAAALALLRDRGFLE